MATMLYQAPINSPIDNAITDLPQFTPTTFPGFAALAADWLNVHPYPSATPATSAVGFPDLFLKPLPPVFTGMTRFDPLDGPTSDPLMKFIEDCDALGWPYDGFPDVTLPVIDPGYPPFSFPPLPPLEPSAPGFPPPSDVPEPGTIGLFAIALLVLRRARQRT